MRHLYKNLILVVLTYSLALSSPVMAQTSNDSFTPVKNYVNGSGKKTYKGLLQKIEKGLTPNVYEEALKRVKTADGNGWFQAAKLATNYSYFRIGNSKIFIRTALEKGKTVFYANGMKIQQSDFKKIRNVENILFLAYVAGISTKKTSLINFVIPEVFAGDCATNRDLPQCEEVAEGSPAALVAQANECEAIQNSITTLVNTGDSAEATNLVTINRDKCPNLTAVVAQNIPAAAAAAQAGNKNGLALFLMAALLMFIVFKSRQDKNDDDDDNEVPEDNEGVGGRDDDDNNGGDGDDDDDGHVNCGGEGAQCPGQPAPPPGSGDTPTSSDDDYDPNQYSVPYSKTRK